MSGTLICDIPYEDFVVRMEEFHGFRSPGILLGALMVEAALKEVGTTPYLNVVTETIVCLPDAVQLLTLCSIGNGFLQVLDWGKFALTAYDRKTLSGIRVWLNYDALAGYPEICGWFERSPKTKKKPIFEELAREILKVGSNLLACQSVKLYQALKTRNMCLQESARIAANRIPCTTARPVLPAAARLTMNTVNLFKN